MIAYHHELFRTLVAQFAEAAGVRRRIRVFTRAALFERYSAHRGGLSEDERRHLRGGHALAIARAVTPHEIYFNPARHASVDDVVDSAAHEVVQLRWQTLEHGRLFDRRKRALINGYSCGPKSSRMGEAFQL